MSWNHQFRFKQQVWGMSRTRKRKWNQINKVFNDVWLLSRENERHITLKSSPKYEIKEKSVKFQMNRKKSFFNFQWATVSQKWIDTKIPQFALQCCCTNYQALIALISSFKTRNMNLDHFNHRKHNFRKNLLTC